MNPFRGYQTDQANRKEKCIKEDIGWHTMLQAIFKAEPLSKTDKKAFKKSENLINFLLKSASNCLALKDEKRVRRRSGRIKIKNVLSNQSDLCKKLSFESLN